MNLRERIENNLIVWLLSTLLVGFLAGIATYQTILEIAQLEVVSKMKLEQLQEAASRGQTAEPAAVPSVSRDLPQVEPTPTPAIPQKAFQFSTEVPPFPEDYDIVRPGMRLSEAKVAFSRGSLGDSWYSVDIDSGPFSGVAFHTFSLEGQEDPVIDAVIFHFRDEDSKRAVLNSALRAYGSLTHRSETLGAKLVWPNLKGFALTIDDDSYNISQADGSS